MQPHAESDKAVANLNEGNGEGVPNSGTPLPVEVPKTPVPEICQALEAQKVDANQKPMEPPPIVSSALAIPEKAVATPCRKNPGNATPSYSPTTPCEEGPSEKPDPQVLRISPAAAEARLRRTMSPSLKDGSYKVAPEIVKQFKKGGKGKMSLLKLFETCGYCKDCTKWSKPN